MAQAKTPGPPGAQQAGSEVQAGKPKEPPETPVRRDHVLEFLRWYGPKVGISRMATDPTYFEPWVNGLSTLNLGELRNGWLTLKRMTRIMRVGVHDFWTLCKNRQSPEAIEKFNHMRKILRDNRSV